MSWSTSQPRQRLALCLEPRMMFDAAAVATTVETQQQAEAQQAEVQSPSAQMSPMAMVAAARGDQALTAPLTEVDLVAETSISGQDLKFLGSATSPTGDLVYVLHSTGEFNSETFETDAVPAITAYRVTDDGSLTAVNTATANDLTGLEGAQAMTLSTDGQQLYVLTQSGLSIFNMERQGELSETQHLPFTDSALIVQDIDRSDSGIYVTTTTQLLEYRETDGRFSQTQSFNLNATDLQLSANQQHLYVATSGESSAMSIFSVAADGRLTQQGQSNAEGTPQFTQQLALDPTGSRLYALTNNDGYRLSQYQVNDDGSLSRVGDALTLNDNEAKDLIVAPDGSAVYVLGQQLNIVSTSDTGLSLSQSMSSFPGETEWDSTFIGSLDHATLTEDGQYLVAGNGGFGAGLMSLKLGVQTPTYTEGDDPSLLLPLAQFESNNLDGATLTLKRASGTHAEDVFGLSQGNGVTLSGTQVSVNGTQIAQLSTTSNGQLTISFNGQATQASVQQLIRQLSYENTHNDPTQQGDQPAFTATFTDSQNQTDTLNFNIHLANTNDPVNIQTQGQSGDYHAGDDAISLYQNTQLDTVEADQLIHTLTLTLSPGDDHDVIWVGEDKITLDKTASALPSPSQSDHYLSYSVDFENDGSRVLTLFMRSEPADAATLIDSLRYSNSETQLSGTRTVQLALVEDDNGSIQRNANGEIDYVQADPVELSLKGPQQDNSAPILTSSTTTLSYTEQANAVHLWAGATLSDQQLDSLNNGQGNYAGSQLKITVSERTDDDHIGFEDTATLALNTDEQGQSTLTSNGREIGQWHWDNQQLVIDFTDTHGAIPTQADITQIVQHITYENTSEGPEGNRQISIALTDPQGLDSAEHTLTLTLQNQNDAPEWTDNALSQIGILTEADRFNDIATTGELATLAQSPDGQYIFVGNAQGDSIAIFRYTEAGTLSYQTTQTVDIDQASDGSGIQQLLVSPDGQFLYVLGNTETTHNDELNVDESHGHQVAIFQISGNGQLTLQDQYHSAFETDQRAFWNSSKIQISDDGQHLYAINTSTVVVLDRDPSTGRLTHQAIVDNSMSLPPYLWSPSDFTVQGDYLFVTTAPSDQHTLIVYQLNDQGLPEAPTFIRDGEVDAEGRQVHLQNARDIDVSANQRDILITDDNGVQHFQFNPDKSTLHYKGALLDSTDIQSLSLEESGQTVTVAYRDQLIDYRFDQGQLTQANALTFEAAQQLHMNDQGQVIALNNQQLSIFDRQRLTLNYALEQEPLRFAQGLDLRDADLSALNGGRGDYQGMTVVLESQSDVTFGFSDDSRYQINESGQIKAGDLVIAELVQNDGGATLTLTTSITRAQANDVVQQLTFATTTPGDHTVTLTLNDGEVNSEPKALTITAGDFLPPELTDDSLTLPEAIGGEAYRFTLPEDLFTDPNDLELTLTVTGLPEGLSFDGFSRTISGTPTVGGEYELTITANNGTLSTSLMLSLMVDMDNLPPEVSEDFPTTLALEPGEAFSHSFDPTLVTDPESGDLTWQIEDLPEGLSFDPETLTLSGTLSEEASYRIKVIITDEAGASVERTLSLTVGDVDIDNQGPAATETPLSLPDATAGVEYQFVLPEGLFNDPDGDTLTLAISGLPSGLTFDPETRTLSGVPETEGTISLTITATDIAGDSADREITLIVLQGNQAPSAGDADITLPHAEIGEQYRYQLPLDALIDPEGNPLTWSLSGLPEGFSFDPDTRTITGLATEEATFELTLTATDDSNASGSRTLILEVTLPPADPALPSQPQIALVNPPNLNSEILTVLDTQTQWRQWDQTSQAHTLDQQWHTFDAAWDRDAKALDEIALTSSYSPSPAIIELTAIRNIAGQQQFELPRTLMTEDQHIQVRQSNGAPLPAWAHFNAAQQRIDIDANAHASEQPPVQQLGVEVQVVNTQGEVQTLFIMLNLSQASEAVESTPHDAAEQEASNPTYSSQTDSNHAYSALPEQLSKAGAHGLFDAAHQLVEALLATQSTATQEAFDSPVTEHRSHTDQTHDLAFVKES